ncbi:hypothetical protein C1141_16880 [Vibrio agarivorans]|uniref:Uncharacterized protein n=1 Tax=Vibrio sagamiensis NBRC 104589 TaxID=1219064 RepID=A0A511QMJ1_9VIBR|nr:hypothetical protein C1141_16880 [Vibrio agarivorans]GEM77732.1 hypothetical protein VSA01S_38440 [Vibrio sagamiensis NBRC 104589]
MDIINLFFETYLIIGGFVTLYVLFMFFTTGHNVFDSPVKPNLAFSNKVSYVLVMSYLFPIFYGVFFNEVLNLRSNVKQAIKPNDRP